MRNTSTYRADLIKAIEELQDLQGCLFTVGLNLLMLHELKDINDVFETGSSHTFEPELLETASDTNVKLIHDAYMAMQSTIESLQNINGITLEELEG